MVEQTEGSETTESAPVSALLRIDFGCGNNKKTGADQEWTGVDSIKFDAVDVVMNVCRPIYGNKVVGDSDDGTEEVARVIVGHKPWPWADNSVTEAYAAHFVEHLDQYQRCHFFNELWRVLVPGGTCQIVTPHWASTRAYGDPTHKWTPVSEMGWYYLKAEWRNGDEAKGLGANAPHTDIAHNPMGYSCDFEAGWGYSMTDELAVKSQDNVVFALSNYINAAQDMSAVITATKPVASDDD